MPRTLDLTALRSFAAVADCGGVTRAAGLLNLTQSAVSMQLKRLEEGLGTELFDRSGRRLVLTQQGEQLLGFARRMVALNDEAVAQLAHGEEQTEIRLGVPSDIVHPAVPEALHHRFIVAVMVTTFVFWAILGVAVSLLRPRFAADLDAPRRQIA